VDAWRLLSYRVGLGRFAPDTDFWTPPRWLNGLLARVYDFPLGVSLVCIARRDETTASGGAAPALDDP
jgi:hypothetical protein